MEPMNPNDEIPLAPARRALDAAARQLDTLTLARLRAARLRALDQARPAAPWRPGWRLAAGGFAAAGLATLVAVGLLWFSAPAPLTVAGIDDLELLSTQENPEFYADLDFYHWLASRRET
jgi:hypothetical protein